MKKSSLALVLGAVLAANFARAETAAPDNTLMANAAVVSDYRFRGISQSRLQPAVQGGVDYANAPTGLYAGTWLSTIKWTKDMGGSGSVEWDIYGGKKGSIVKDLDYDVGVLSYVYPSNGLSAIAGSANANTTEIYGQLSSGPAYIKYSNTMTNAFGTANSKHSGYVDAGSNIDAGAGITVNLHIGHQFVKNNSASDYTDWKVGVSKDVYGVTLGVAAIGAHTQSYKGPAPDMKNLARNGVVFSVSKMFM